MSTHHFKADDSKCVINDLYNYRLPVFGVIKKSFCEHYFDVRVICEEDESVDSIALKAIATADRYPKDKGRYIFVI